MSFLPASVRLEHDRQMAATFKAMHNKEYRDFPERERVNQSAGECPICRETNNDAHVAIGEGIEQRLETSWIDNLSVQFKWQVYHTNPKECIYKIIKEA